MKTKRNYIVEVCIGRQWSQSWNVEADGRYTKASAERRAKYQQDSQLGMKYRAKEIK